jgi:murein DD-endopeptidase MepM/ murein hydrolase activator NlpD
MTVRIAKAELRIAALAAILVLPLIATGCTPTPEPYFGWDTKPAPRKVAAKPKPRPRYADDRAYCSCNNPSSQSARQNQKWYDQPADRYDDSSNDSYDRDARFQWPVRGRVVSEFGSYGGGERNNGINIAAQDRTPIRAAADGTISYAGNELRNYGNLVLIKHNNGYVTAYAHADEFVVSKGQWVAKGQVIGYVGMTGDVRSPQLHFELRRGAHGETPVDPRPLLGSMQVANR